MRKIKALAIALGWTLFILALPPAPAAAGAAEKRAINPPGTAEGLPFSNGIVVGNMLFVAGQEGLENGKPRDGGIGPQTDLALQNIKKIVEGAGFSMKDVVSVTVFLADVNDFPEMNKVYKTYFPDPKPARATVQVADLVLHAKVEISAIAVKSK
jgi:2-iminobutanoate/2-iminopropanoate deaminase